MYEYFERVLPRLPPLRVPMVAARMRPVLVYTDASFAVVGGRRVARLGMYVFDPVTGAEFWAKLIVPESFYAHFAPDMKTYIAQVELLVAIAAYFTVPDLLRGRAVLHFIDNTTALSALVNGYARKPDCAALVNSFHETVMDLRCYIWAEWVPSAANIADWPSRPELERYVPSSAVEIDLVLPPLPLWAELADEMVDETEM
jgi:hypothetical protein